MRTTPASSSGHSVPASNRHLASASASTAARVESQFHNTSRNAASTKQDLLDALITNQLPMTTETVAFASPLQFHGRPAAPRTLRLDAGHELPKPHAPAIAPLPSRRQIEPTREVPAHESPAGETSAETTRTYRIDPSAATGATSRFVPVKHAETTSSPTTKPAASNTMSGAPSVAGAKVRSPLDRALSAVQKRGERS
jgi:hypothetical protein